MGTDDLPVGEGTEVLQRSAVLDEGARDIRDGHAWQMPVKLANSELGLPLSISVPSSLQIRPGELVDLTLVPKTDATQ